MLELGVSQQLEEAPHSVPSESSSRLVARMTPQTRGPPTRSPALPGGRGVRGPQDPDRPLAWARPPFVPASHFGLCQECLLQSPRRSVAR